MMALCMRQQGTQPGGKYCVEKCVQHLGRNLKYYSVDGAFLEVESVVEACTLEQIHVFLIGPE